MLAVAMRHARTMLLAALARAAPPPELSTSLNPTFPSTDAVRRPIYGELAARVNGTFGVDYPEARLARALRWRGSDTRLRTALAAAAKNPNRTFVALVLGGSEAAGAQCESEVPGVRRLGLFAYWKQPGRQGGRKSRPDCAWPARLARYLATVLPNLNFLVVDGAFPGSDTQFSLTTLKSHQCAACVEDVRSALHHLRAQAQALFRRRPGAGEQARRG